jgi:tRNA(Ile)-lysidine synthetase-like protein
MIYRDKGETFYIPGSLRVERVEGAVTIKPPSEEPYSAIPAIEVRIGELPRELEFGPWVLYFSILSCEEKRTHTDIKHSQNTVNIAAGGPLTVLKVRSPEPGDRIALLGMNGLTKKLSDVFVDRRIPRWERIVQPVIEDKEAGKVLSLPSLSIISEEARITEKTRRYIEIRVVRKIGSLARMDMLN